MIQDVLAVIAALGLVMIVGRATLRLTCRSRADGWAATLAADYGIGAVALSLWMLVLALAAVPFSLVSVGLLAIPSCLVLLWGGRGTFSGWPRAPITAGWRRPALEWTRLFELAPLLAVLLVLAVAAALALSRPETNWDTLSHWGLKAKAFWLHRTIWLWDYDAHNYYPLLVPLTTTWLYLTLDRVDEVLAKTISLGFGLALIALFYSALRTRGHPRFLAGLLTLLLLVGANQLFQQLLTNQADLALTYYLAGLAISLDAWRRQPRQTERLLLAGLFGGGAAWTKYEGLFIVVTLLLALALSLRLADLRGLPWRPAIGLAALIGVPALAWAAFRSTNGIPVEGEHIAALLVPARLPEVTLGFLRYLVTGRSAGLWLGLFGVWLLSARRSLAWPHRFLALALLFNLLAIVWAFDVTGEDPLGQIERAGGRLLMHIAPIGLLLLGSLAHDWLYRSPRPGSSRPRGAVIAS